MLIDTSRVIKSQLFPLLTDLYDHIVISLAPGMDETFIQALEALPVQVAVTQQWGSGRYLCLRMVVETTADTLHYVDADRLIRWVELYPDELRKTIAFIQKHEVVVIDQNPEVCEDIYARYGAIAINGNCTDLEIGIHLKA